jgi:hypothetical protein
MFPFRQVGQVLLAGGPLFAFTFRTLTILTLPSSFTSPHRDRRRTSPQFAGRAEQRDARRTWCALPKSAHELRAHASIAARDAREECDVLAWVEPTQFHVTS